MISATQPVPFLSATYFYVCRHVSFFNIKDLNRYFRAIRISDWKVRRDSFNEERVMRCRYCRSDFHIDFKQFGRRGNALYVTKWFDLGQGPLERSYRSHLGNGNSPPWREIKFDIGSIRAAFEGTDQFDFDSDAVISSGSKKVMFVMSWVNWLDNIVQAIPL